MVRVAYELIARKGLHQMTLQDVADAAKVSKANVVHHFKTKENLVLVTMRWVLGRVAAAVLPSADDPEGMIRTLVDVIFVDAKRVAVTRLEAPADAFASDHRRESEGSPVCRRRMVEAGEAHC